MNTKRIDTLKSSIPCIGIAGRLVLEPLRGLAVISMALTLTACGTYGEPLLLSAWFDSNDKCQLKNNGGNFPSYCGNGSAGRTYIYATPTNNPIGNNIGYSKK